MHKTGPGRPRNHQNSGVLVRSSVRQLISYSALVAGVVAISVLATFWLERPKEQAGGQPSGVTPVAKAPDIPEAPSGRGRALYRSCADCPWILVGQDGRQWSLPTAAPDPEHPSHPGRTAVSLSPDGGQLLYSAENEDGVVYDLVNGKRRRLPRSVGVLDQQATWSANGQLMSLTLANGTTGGEVVVVDAASLRTKIRVPRVAADHVAGIDPAGRLVTLRPTFTQNPGGVISGAEPQTRQAVILAANADGKVEEAAVTDPSGLLKPGEGIARPGYRPDAVLSPDGKLLAVAVWNAGGQATGVALVDVTTGRIERRLGGASQPIPSNPNLCGYVSDGLLIASRHVDNRGVSKLSADTGRASFELELTGEVVDVDC